MIYKYDESLSAELQRSFSPDGCVNPTVKVVESDKILELIAQLQEDDVEFPLVVLTRNEDVEIDKSRMNFTRAHRGVVAILDKETNELYYEKAIPIDLGYTLTILATNTADVDELVKELLFKYTSMYFIQFTLPYECKRKIRYGVRIDVDVPIERKSGYFDYIDGGHLYQATLALKCDGAVLVSYTPAKLRRTAFEIEPTTNNNKSTGSEP